MEEETQSLIECMELTVEKGKRKRRKQTGGKSHGALACECERKCVVFVIESACGLFERERARGEEQDEKRTGGRTSEHATCQQFAFCQQKTDLFVRLYSFHVLCVFLMLSEFHSSLPFSHSLFSPYSFCFPGCSTLPINNQSTEHFLCCSFPLPLLSFFLVCHPSSLI